MPGIILVTSINFILKNILVKVPFWAKMMVPYNCPDKGAIVGFWFSLFRRRGALALLLVVSQSCNCHLLSSAFTQFFILKQLFSLKYMSMHSLQQKYLQLYIYLPDVICGCSKNLFLPRKRDRPLVFAGQFLDIFYEKFQKWLQQGLEEALTWKVTKGELCISAHSESAGDLLSDGLLEPPQPG